MSGWTTKKLGEVCEEIRERISSAEIPLAAYITTDNMLKNCAGVCEAENLPPKICSLVAYQSGDILLSNIRPYLKKIWLADRSGGASSDVIVLRPRFENILARYIYRALARDEFFDFSMLNVTGTKMPRGKRDWIKSFEIPIPPLAEQKRIVAKIDAAFEKIDRLKANAEKNLANAKELFQSALDEAMRPKKGWVEKRLGEIGSCKNGLNFKRAAEGEKIDIVCVKKKKKGLVVDDATELERLTLQELPEQEWYLHPNDIVFVRSNGSKALVGRAVIIKSKRPLTFSGFCIRYRIEDKRIDPDYLARIVSVESFRKAMLSGRNATTINNVTQPILLSQVISIPSLGEQKQIIKHLDFLSEKIKMLEQNYARQIADCAEMRQAILREAFEGRL